MRMFNFTEKQAVIFSTILLIVLILMRQVYPTLFRPFNGMIVNNLFELFIGGIALISTMFFVLTAKENKDD